MNNRTFADIPTSTLALGTAAWAAPSPHVRGGEGAFFDINAPWRRHILDSGMAPGY